METRRCVHPAIHLLSPAEAPCALAVMCRNSVSRATMDGLPLARYILWIWHQALLSCGESPPTFHLRVEYLPVSVVMISPATARLDSNLLRPITIYCVALVYLTQWNSVSAAMYRRTTGHLTLTTSLKLASQRPTHASGVMIESQT